MAQAVADIPRPPGKPLAFMGGNLLHYRRDALGFLLENAQQYGDIVKIMFGPYHVYQINHPDDVRDVLVTHADKFHKSIVYKRLLSQYLGNGLLISDGDYWKRQRRLAQPAFHTKRINAYAETMVDYTQRLVATWQPGTTRNIAEDMMKLTLYIVAKTLFDADVSSVSHQVGEALEVLLISVIGESNFLIRTPDWLPTPFRARKKWSIETLHKIVDDVIQMRRATGEDKGDLLSMLLLAQDDDGTQMTNEQVRDETLTIFLAGHETTANAMTWTFYLLSQHPAVEAALAAELVQVLNGRAPTLADLPRLTYTEMVLKESMRLYPPAWSFARMALENVMIGEYTLPKYDTALVIPYVIHRDARWFANPNQFDPERFNAENEKHIPKYAYLPFGGGARVCIGNSFAMMEAKLILATIAQQYRLTLKAGQRVEPEPLVTLRPKYGMAMTLQPR